MAMPLSMSPTISVLANSLPRGGPFLLGSALQLLGYQKYAGVECDNSIAAFNYLEAQKTLAGRQTQAGENMIGVSPFSPCYLEQTLVRKSLSHLAHNEYIPAHIPWSPALSGAMRGLNCRHIAILRDPRALLLSLLFDTHPMPRFLIKPFETMSAETQLALMLDGGSVPQSEMTLQAFHDVYLSMLSWQNAENCLIVRYEDLSGPKGGGSHQQQQEALQQIASFLDLPMHESMNSHEQLAMITDPSVPVFRTDQAAQWETNIDRTLVERVVDSCKPLAQAAGYGEIVLQGRKR